MEYESNANESNDQSFESEGDSITIDNNDYEDYSDENIPEDNQNKGGQVKPKKIV